MLVQASLREDFKNKKQECSIHLNERLLKCGISIYIRTVLKCLLSVPLCPNAEAQTVHTCGLFFSSVVKKSFEI
jgi:hypothetical protein